MSNYRFIEKAEDEMTPIQAVQSNIHANICTQLLSLLYEQRKHRDYKAAKQIVHNAQKMGMMFKDTSRIKGYAINNDWADIIILLEYVNQTLDTIRKFEGNWQDCINEDEDIFDPSEADF